MKTRSIKVSDPPSDPVERPILLGVIGGETPPEKARHLAEEVGALAAQRGAIIVCGGHGGVMESVCKGAARAGGTTIGVLPSSDRHTANPYVTIPIVTAMSTARNAIIVRTAEALIAIDGAYGTLTEIAYALDLKHKVFLLESWPLERIPVDENLFEKVSTPRDAVERALAYARENRSRP
jgi:uncharacterized protein (TIGR00725 family)